jgi:hypothetical protein
MIDRLDRMIDTIYWHYYMTYHLNHSNAFKVPSLALAGGLLPELDDVSGSSVTMILEIKVLVGAGDKDARRPHQSLDLSDRDDELTAGTPGDP